MENDGEKYGLKTVEKALGLLELFYDERELGAAEAARSAGISRSTAFRFLTTLEAGGYLVKSAQNKYSLSLKLFSLGQLAYSRLELAGSARQELCRLALETGETAHFSVMDGLTSVIFIDKGLPSSLLKMDVPLGARYEAHLTASGKAMLAFQTRDFIDRYLQNARFERRFENSIAGAQELMDALRETRARGLATDNEEAEAGLTCIAAPILNNRGVSVAAVSVSGPTTRMLKNAEKTAERLRTAARDIARTVR